MRKEGEKGKWVKGEKEKAVSLYLFPSFPLPLLPISPFPPLIGGSE